jgi:hypothetical protein
MLKLKNIPYRLPCARCWMFFTPDAALHRDRGNHLVAMLAINQL